jgi:hypothetical protein
MSRFVSGKTRGYNADYGSSKNRGDFGHKTETRLLWGRSKVGRDRRARREQFGSRPVR